MGYAAGLQPPMLGRPADLMHRWVTTEAYDSAQTDFNFLMLYQEAKRGAELNAHVPYSGRGVGCALQTDIGVIKSGNVENCAYPNSICAVKAAVVAGVAQGMEEIREVAVHTADGAPCGCCLEFLKEFVEPTTPIHLASNEEGFIRTSCLAELTPIPRNPVPSPFLQKSWKEPMPEHAAFKEALEVDPKTCTDEALMRLALKASERCYTPTSHFPVGAAMLYMDSNGVTKVATAANVEHSVIGLGLCAERSCICAANAADGSLATILRLAVVCPKLPDFGRPCGGCRQGLVEYGFFPVIQTRLTSEGALIAQTESTDVILPNAFSPAALSSASP